MSSSAAMTNAVFGMNKNNRIASSVWIALLGRQRSRLSIKTTSVRSSAVNIFLEFFSKRGDFFGRLVLFGRPQKSFAAVFDLLAYSLKRLNVALRYIASYDIAGCFNRPCGEPKHRESGKRSSPLDERPRPRNLLRPKQASFQRHKAVMRRIAKRL